MATWAVGDIQGCAGAYFRLLDRIEFNPQQDTLWIAGDLVNRGEDNLSVLRHIKNLGARAKVVLGNHDLHLIATWQGIRPLSRKDTLHDVLAASDCNELLEWLACQPLLVAGNGFVMTHAGVPHIWGLAQAKSAAMEVEGALANSESRLAFLKEMYGNEPPGWRKELTGTTRLRVITNYFTRMRFITVNGGLDFDAKTGESEPPPGHLAWFRYPRQMGESLLFGHWAALEGECDIDGIYALDTGCVWGGELTALNLETLERVSVPA